MLNRFLKNFGWILVFVYVGMANADQTTILNAALNGGSYPWDTARGHLNDNFDDLYAHWTLITVTTSVDLDAMDALIDANVIQVSEFVTLSGVPAHSTDFGTFPGGTTIPDNSDNKEALAALEIAVEAAAGGGVWGGITGTLTNQTDLNSALDAKADSLTADQNYVTDAQLVVIGNTAGANAGDVTLDTANGLSLVGQILSLAAATNGNAGAMTAALVTNLESLVTLTGVAADSTTLGTFPGGTTITDNSTIKVALQELEVAVEAGGGSFDPASPGEIGGTTPAAATFTEIDIPFVDEAAGLIWSDANTAFTPGAGTYGIEPEAAGIMAIINGVKTAVLEGDTAVTPGSYTAADITVDQQGRITAAANGSGGAGGYVAVPTYSDETCTLGTYSWDASYYYGCESTDQWDRFAVTWAAWSNPTPSIPTMTSATIPTTGATVSLLFSEAITVGSGGNGGWTLNTPTNAMTYSSGDTTDTLIYTLASTINTGDTPTITYTQPGDGLESGTGGDLATIVAAAVVNNSTQGGSACTGDKGNTGIGASTSDFATFQMKIHRVALGCSGTINDISAYLSGTFSAGSEIKFVIYSDNGSGTDPDTLLYESAALQNPSSAAAWLEQLSVSEVLSGDPAYVWIGVRAEFDTTKVYWDTGGDSRDVVLGDFTTAAPASWPTGTDTARSESYSIFIGTD